MHTPSSNHSLRSCHAGARPKSGFSRESRAAANDGPGQTGPLSPATVKPEAVLANGTLPSGRAVARHSSRRARGICSSAFRSRCH